MGGSELCGHSCFFSFQNPSWEKFPSWVSRPSKCFYTFSAFFEPQCSSRKSSISINLRSAIPLAISHSFFFRNILKEDLRLSLSWISGSPWHFLLPDLILIFLKHLWKHSLSLLKNLLRWLEKLPPSIKHLDNLLVELVSSRNFFLPSGHLNLKYSFLICLGRIKLQKIILWSLVIVFLFKGFFFLR